MNKDQNLIAEVYGQINEANPMQQQMRNMMTQKMQQRMAKAEQNQPQQSQSTSPSQSAQQPTQPVQQQVTNTRNFDGVSGLPITPEGDKLFAQTPNPAETLRQNGFKSLEHFQAARDAGSWTPSSKQPQSTQPQQRQQPQSTQPQQQQNTQQVGNPQQVQAQMAELGKQLTQFQQKFNEIMKSLGGNA
jgi:hypothetical protein